MAFNIFVPHESADPVSRAKYSHDIQQPLLERQIRLNLDWSKQPNLNISADDYVDC